MLQFIATPQHYTERAMSRQVKVTVSALLLFQAMSCVLAVPVLNAVKQTDSVREVDGDSNYVLNRQRRRSWPVMNSYITEFFINSTIIKDSNCSDLFLGQSVSQAFCASKSIYISYSSAEGKKCLGKIIWLKPNVYVVNPSNLDTLN